MEICEEMVGGMKTRIAEVDKDIEDAIEAMN